MNESWIDEVIRFWFGELNARQWFVCDEHVDALVRERFGALYDRLREREASDFTSPQASLAAVLVLDQFPRNLFRASPRAYESDAKALAISQAAIARGDDMRLNAKERMFLYMPWQHSEDAGVQARSVELFAALGEPEALDYAKQHKEVIDRFGRFPHRNVILGRESTDDEIGFLKTHPGF